MRRLPTAPVPAPPNGPGLLPRRPPRDQLSAGTLRHLELSLKRQMKRYRRGLKRCQQNFSPSAVHESRVETRRLLSIVELLQPFIPAGRVRKTQAALKRHRDTFDELRDTQVQKVAVAKMRRHFPAARVFARYLGDREDRFTRQTRKAIKRIKTKRLQKLISACRQDARKWRGIGLSDLANQMLLAGINRAFNQTRRLKDKIDRNDTDTIHYTRVAFKKFRYMVETLASRLPLADEKLLAAMHHYQTMMGDIQDAEVLLRTLDKFLLKKPAALPGARRFRAECLRRRRWLIRVFMDAAGQLGDFWPGMKTPLRGSRRRTIPQLSSPVAPRYRATTETKPL